MDFAIGLAGAYVKIIALAVVIMAAVWVACIISVRLHENKRRDQDDEGPGLQ